MTDPTVQPDEDVIALAGRLFEAARTGDAALLAAYLDAGTPPTSPTTAATPC